MDSLISIAGTLGLFLIAGGLIGIAAPNNISARWLFISLLLVALNDSILTRFYGLMPRALPSATLNWQGQLVALLFTLAVSALPGIGWSRVGITLAQRTGSLRAAWPVIGLYILFVVILAAALPNGDVTAEDIAFQLTAPGLQEETFYRGLLLLCLDRAFASRWHFLGVDWSWGAVLSCMLFGLAHAFGFSDGAFSFDPIIMALTTLPSFAIVWVRLRTGSVAIPILLHNFGNTVTLFV